MKDLKRAFGSPDPEFTDRVRQTLFRIEEKEEEPVKKKLTFSMAMAMILCVCIVSVSAFAGTALITAKPDVTRSPLSQSENSNPGSTPDPFSSMPILSDVYWLKDAGNIFHWDETCKNMSYPYTVMSFSSALEAGGQLCPLCFGEFSGFAALPALTDSPVAAFSTPTPMPMGTVTPQPTADTDPVSVWSAAGDTYYHANLFCPEAKENTARVTLDFAESRGQTACPSCGALYYSYYELISNVYLPENSDTFHRTTDCAELSLPCTVPTLVAALEAGAHPCPLCMNTADPESAGDSPATVTPVPGMATQIPYATAAFGVSASTTPVPPCADTDNPLVYVSQDQTTFHYVSSLACTDNAGMLTPMSLTDALNEGALPCHECRTCWTEEGRDLYHLSESCSLLTDAQLQLVSTLPDEYQPCARCVRFYDLNNNLYHRFPRCSEFGDDGKAHAYLPCSLNFPALIGSTPCKLCVPESDPALLQTPMLTAEPTPTPMPTVEPLPISGTVCLSSSDDRFFHRTFICGLTAADSSMSLLDALNAGYAPCPDCYGDDAVYTVNGGDSYHTSDKTCFLFLASSSSFADVSLTEALLRNKRPCGSCVLEATDDPVYYYTPDDWFCHSSLACFGEDEIAIGSETEEKLIAMGKRACEACMEPFSYYYTVTDAYYHSIADCAHAGSLMSEKMPEDQLIERNKRNCPWCLDWYNCYYSEEDPCYHKSSGCERYFGAQPEHSSEADLIEMGKLPCQNCFPTICYSPEDDPHFHSDMKCCSEAKKIRISTMEEMLELQKTPCGICFEKTAFLSEDSAFYHSAEDCTAFESSDYSEVPQEYASASGKSACPACVLTDRIFWPDQDGGHPYYHVYGSCAALQETDVTGSVFGTLLEAQSFGKTLCPDCASSAVLYSLGDDCYHLSEDCLRQRSVKPIAEITLCTALVLKASPCDDCIPDDLYYFTEFSGSYHAAPDCASSFHRDISFVTEADAAVTGLTPCNRCVVPNSSDVQTEAAVLVYSTPNGSFYHTIPDCTGMKNAEPVVLAEALSRSQTACPFCAERNAPVDSSIVFLWDPEAPVYHAVYDCSGYEYLHQMELTDAAARNLTPCPECLNTEEKVWYTQDSEYYHSCLHYAYLNLPDVIERSPIDALADGKRPCPNCMLTETAKGDATLGSVPPWWATGDGHIFFYDYSQGHADALHFSADCTAMENPVAVSLETAVKYELWHCDLCSDDYLRSDCIVERDDTVYHLSDTCREFVSADLLTRWDVLLLGLEPCPDCAWEQADRTGPIPTVPPQPAMPPADDQSSLKRWLLSEEEQRQCLTDLGYSK